MLFCKIATLHLIMKRRKIIMDSQKMKILIVDDEEDLRELLSFMIESETPSKTILIPSGNQAIEWLKDNDFDYDMIFCDYNMPNGNGGDLFKYLVEKKKDQPFVLVSSDSPQDYALFRGYKNVHSLLKPFGDKDLHELMQYLTLNRACHENWAHIKVDVLGKFEKSCSDIYVKVSDEKYVKVFNKGQSISGSEYNKYKDKGLEYFYITKSEAPDFIRSYKNYIISQNLTQENLSKDSIDVLESSLNIIKDFSHQLGWTEDVQNLTQQNLILLLSELESNPKLSNVFELVKSSEDFASHSSSIAYVCTGIALQLKSLPKTSAKSLALAALIHDVHLSDLQIKNEKDYVLALKNHQGNKLEGLQVFKSHPHMSADLVRDWPQADPIVERIILEHHEHPDGTGFPNQKMSSELSELSRIFILSEDICEYINYSRIAGTEFNLNNCLSELKITYKDDNFQQIIDQLMIN